MAKRFTDTNKWEDAWFMDLPSKYKLFWYYILDNCDHAGVWKVNFKLANFFIGEHLEPSEVYRNFNGRFDKLNDENWMIVKFIQYQYNVDIQGLNPKNKVHLSVLKLLKRFDKFKGLKSTFEGTKDKEKDKDKDKSKVKAKDVNPEIEELILHYNSFGYMKKKLDGALAIRLLTERLKDAEVIEIKKVISMKWFEWEHTKMRNYFIFETLFLKSNFTKYLEKVRFYESNPKEKESFKNRIEKEKNGNESNSKKDILEQVEQSIKANYG